MRRAGRTGVGLLDLPQLRRRGVFVMVRPLLSSGEVEAARQENGPELTERGEVDLTGLTEREREVFMSCHVHGLRPVDVARELGVSPSTVRTILSRVRRKRGDR